MATKNPKEVSDENKSADPLVTDLILGSLENIFEAPWYGTLCYGSFSKPIYAFLLKRICQFQKNLPFLT